MIKNPQMFSRFCFVLLGVLAASPSWAAPVIFCELASLPVLPLASDLSERLSPEELLSRVAESYRGLLEFGGDVFSEVRLQSRLHEASLEKFFEPVPGRDQRSVALNESLAKLGDWVTLEAEDHGLKQEMALMRLREVVRSYIDQGQEEQGRTEETREERRSTGIETSTGAIFHRDTRFPELGEAYRDPGGMVWGDVVRKGRGSAREMNHEDALESCKSIGAELPSEEDFTRLREYMGAQPSTNPRGYSAQILPELNHRSFWSSSVRPNFSDSFCVFHGVSGRLGYLNGETNLFSVRCVRRLEAGSMP